MIRKGFRNNRAVTLTELLVVLAIIALLATIAVPVYINQMQRARIAAAQLETRQIAEAMQMAAVTHGFLVPIHILDNVPNRDSSGNGGASGSYDNFDNITNATNINVIDIARSLGAQDGSNQLNLASSDARVERMIETWQGPFLNPKRVRYEDEDLATNNPGILTRDLVVDPWGNPYRVYTDFGLASSQNVPTQTNQQISVNMDNLLINTNEASRFDRFAIVSYGPDGLTGFANDNPLEQGDDIYYTFSINPGNESKYQFY